MLGDSVSHFVRHLLRSFAWGAVLLAAVFVGGDLVQDALARVPDGDIGAVPYETLLSLVVGVGVIALPAALVFFSSFAFFHDAAHGALGLKQRDNDVVLMLTSIPLFMSAHAQRQHHLHHHARPLEPSDLEGKGALTSLRWAALVAPLASWEMRLKGFVVVPDKVKPWVAVENILNAASVVVVVALDHPGVWVSFLVQAVLQHTMNAWASHVPHRAPRWLLGIASRFAWTGSPVVLSLVYHLEHHAHPRVPCALLRPDLDVQSPLLEVAAARPLPWAQLQLETRPRPKFAAAPHLVSARSEV
jgi:fatty acid desaturase